MAKPVTVLPKPAESPDGARAELRRRIEEAPIDHAEALLALWDLLEAAHENHVLEIARGALHASNDVVERLAHGAKSEGATRAMRNLLLLGEVLGSLDPEILRGVLGALPGALARAHEETRRKEPPSLFQIVGRLMSRDGRRAQGLFASLFTSVGHALPARNKDGRERNGG
ncbi:MAG TPA: hypothetical protein VK841_20345 [Polyangiaceae bacterium]|jgi:uncharacterized protein YjgD (DUF1641 family)|nr:hypothetical protein [Polyangiaceae bacterium]